MDMSCEGCVNAVKNKLQNVNGNLSKHAFEFTWFVSRIFLFT